MQRWLTLLLFLVHMVSPAWAKVPQGVISEGDVEGVQAYRLANGLRVLLVCQNLQPLRSRSRSRTRSARAMKATAKLGWRTFWNT
jgi:hypothetical protein